MNTKELYYQDSHLTRFDARVLACTPDKEGWKVTLDATAFFPEGGGQAGDTGTLSGVRVVDTRLEGGIPVHICRESLQVGAQVTGEIDYEPRFIRMQQHSGEHILSGLVFRKYGYHNSGFHMNLRQMQVDFDGVIPAEDLPELELAANRAVWENIPLHCWTPEPEELKTIAYRTKRALPWPVRIVEIPGYDTCACCGTHVAATGEIGIVKIYSAVPFRGGTRLEMACGIPAYRRLAELFEENRRVSQCLSVPMEETGQGAARLVQQLADAKFRITGLERERLESIARQYQGAGNAVCFADTLQVRELAERIAAFSGGTAAVFGTGGSYCLADHTGDVRPLNRALTEAFQGRGGGKPACTQGKLQGDEEAIRAFLSQYGF